MNRISHYLVTRRAECTHAFVLHHQPSASLQYNNRGTLFTPLASLKYLNPIICNYGTYLASQTRWRLSRQFSTSPEGHNNDKETLKTDIIHKKEFFSLGTPTKPKVYDDPNNVILPGYKAGKPAVAEFISL
jgi:hypothetical protein